MKLAPAAAGAVASSTFASTGPVHLAMNTAVIRPAVLSGCCLTTSKWGLPMGSALPVQLPIATAGAVLDQGARQALRFAGQRGCLALEPAHFPHRQVRSLCLRGLEDAPWIVNPAVYATGGRASMRRRLGAV